MVQLLWYFRDGQWALPMVFRCFDSLQSIECHYWPRNNQTIRYRIQGSSIELSCHRISAGLRIRITSMRIRIHLFSLMRIRSASGPAPHHSNANLQPLIVYRPSRAPFWASTPSFKVYKLLDLYFETDPDLDPAFPYYANPDPAFHSKCGSGFATLDIGA